MSEEKIIEYDVTYTVVDESSVKIPKNAIPIGMKDEEHFTRDEFGRSIIEKRLIVIYLQPRKGS